MATEGNEGFIFEARCLWLKMRGPPFACRDFWFICGGMRGPAENALLYQRDWAEALEEPHPPFRVNSTECEVWEINLKA